MITLWDVLWAGLLASIFTYVIVTWTGEVTERDAPSGSSAVRPGADGNPVLTSRSVTSFHKIVRRLTRRHTTGARARTLPRVRARSAGGIRKVAAPVLDSVQQPSLMDRANGLASGEGNEPETGAAA